MIVKLRKKLLSVAAAALALTAGIVTVSATASAATPTPAPVTIKSDHLTDLWVCQSRGGALSWPVNNRCMTNHQKKRWSGNDYYGHGRPTALVAPLETLTLNFGSGGSITCSGNTSPDPKNPVFNCLPMGRLAQVLNPPPLPTATTRPTFQPTVRPTVRPTFSMPPTRNPR